MYVEMAGLSNIVVNIGEMTFNGTYLSYIRKKGIKVGHIVFATIFLPYISIIIVGAIFLKYVCLLMVKTVVRLMVKIFNIEIYKGNKE
jgi:hypothetical protein